MHPIAGRAHSMRIRPMRILCVEDEPLQRKLLGACIELIAGEPLFAASGCEAVGLFRKHAVDLILLDMNQPAGDGFTALNQIRHLGLRGQQVPVLAISDNITGLPESAYRKLGFSALYVKPVEPYRLLDRMDASLIAAGQPPLFRVPVG